MPARARLKPEILAVTLGDQDEFDAHARSSKPAEPLHARGRRTRTSAVPGLSIMDVCALVHRRGG